MSSAAATSTDITFFSTFAASNTTAALASFIADLPHYPRHLYRHSERPVNNSHASSSISSSTLLALSSTPTAAPAARYAQPRPHNSSTGSVSALHPFLDSTRRKQHADDSSSSGNSRSGAGIGVLSHRPLTGRSEKDEERVEQQERRETRQRQQQQQAPPPLSPLDFLLTQQAHRREAAAHRLEQMRWREHCQQADAKTITALSSRAITTQQRSAETAERRRSRDRTERQAAQQFAKKRQEKEQADKYAVNQWGEKADNSSAPLPQPLAELTIAVEPTQTQPAEEGGQENVEVELHETSDSIEQHVQAEGDGEDEREPEEIDQTVQTSISTGSRDGQQQQQLAALAALSDRSGSTSRQRSPQQPQQQHQPIALSPSSSHSDSRPPLLSLLYFLSCLPASCDAMEWAALCLSHLPLRSDVLGKLAEFLGAAHSVIHIMHQPTPAQTTGEQQQSLNSAHLTALKAVNKTADVDTCDVAWLSGLLVPPPCAYLPLPDLLTPPQQSQSIEEQQAAFTPRAGVSSDGVDCTAVEKADADCSVHTLLHRHFVRLCEWRWSRQEGPSAAQLLHLIHIVAHKADVDAQSRPGNAADGRSGSVRLVDDMVRVRPARRLAELFHASLTERRLAGAALSASSPASSSRTVVSFSVFSVLFSCLFVLSSFPVYRSPAAVCASIDRVFSTVLPVTAEERVKQEKQAERKAMRAAEAERRAEVLRLRAAKAEEAEHYAQQRQEERRVREAAILSLHPRACEWSAAAVSGVFVRTLPPHPLPPLSLGYR